MSHGVGKPSSFETNCRTPCRSLMGSLREVQSYGGGSVSGLSSCSCLLTGSTQWTILSRMQMGSSRCILDHTRSAFKALRPSAPPAWTQTYVGPWYTVHYCTYCTVFGNAVLVHIFVTFEVILFRRKGPKSSNVQTWSTHNNGCHARCCEAYCVLPA